MNVRHSLRLLAVIALVFPAVRVFAQTSTFNPAFDNRVFTLELMTKEANEASEREARRQALPAPAKRASLSAANFDLNKDGKLDDTEFAAFTGEVRKVAARSSEAMKRFDANRDGKLDDAEWKAAVNVLFGER